MQLNKIVNTALVGAIGISDEILDQITQAVIHAREMHYWPSETLRLVREQLQRFDALLAQHISDSVLSAWVYGFDDVAKRFPAWLQREFETTVRRTPPPPTPPADNSLFKMFDTEPELKLPIIENAMQRLLERRIMTREQFDAASSAAKAQAFEIAGGLSEDTIDRMRQFLVDDMIEGTSLGSFRKRVEEHLGTSPIAAGHLENVYRTNMQSAIRDGRETLRQNPLVKATFPYQAYVAVHDARARHTHRELEKLGLNGTNVYRVDDPVWDHFTPPWDYNCRCSVRLLTLEQAARDGVKEAQEWLRTGRPPLQPEYRLAHIPFDSNPDWGSRGKVGFVAMSLVRMGAYRAPSGYTKSNPLMIAGKAYVGGEFIPSSEFDKANAEQKKEIATGKKFAAGSEVDLSKLKLSDDQRGVIASIGKEGRSFAPGQDIFMGGRHRRAVQSLLDKGIITRSEENGAVTYKKVIVQTAPVGQQPRAIAGPAPRVAHSQPAVEPKPPVIPPAVKQPKRKLKPPTNEGNWHYDRRDFFKSGLKAKFRDNVDAIRTLKTLELENRPATKAEQEKLSKYVGWGQFPQLFVYSWRDDQWAKEREELRGLVGDKEYESARASTINAHYTHPDIVDANWKMAERLGFKGGRFLEPAVGSGYYIGMMPESLAKETTVTAVEMDQLTGGLAKQLYPSANVQISPFQDFKTPDDFYDIVSTNVPFSGEIRIKDPKYKGNKPLLHDYYFMRSVDTAKPGGLIMHLTSAGTMDKLDPKVRNYINSEAELVAAVRFPGDAHKENAGTSVVTDMLILRKKHPDIPPVTEETPSEAEPKQPGFTGVTVDALGRLYHWEDGKRVPAPKWDDIVSVPDPAGGDPIQVNRYFAEHPDQILGTLDRTGSMYTSGQMNVSRTDDYEQRLQEAIDRLPAGAFWADKEPAADKPEQQQRIEADQKYAEGQLVNKDGAIYQHFGGALTPVNLSADQRERVIGQMAIRDAARGLIAAQQAGEGIESARAELNRAYDEYVGQYGLLHDAKNRNSFKLDPEGKFLLSLERYNSTTKQADKADIFSRDTIRPNIKADSASSVSDATGIVLNESAFLDVNRISQLTGKSTEEVESELIDGGLAFREPNGGKWVESAEYLSGNVRRKLQEARVAAASDPAFDVNVKALEANQPEDIDAEDIGVKVGSPWVPASIVKQFAADVLGAREDDFAIRYADNLNEWYATAINNSVHYRSSNREVWGVQNDAGDIAVSFMDILGSALNGKAIVIRSAYEQDGTHPVLQEATEKAREKVEELKARFKDWVWEDDDRRAQLHRFYNDNYNNIVSRHFDGSHLTLPGMISKWPGTDDPVELRQMQKDFIWRVITTGKGLAAHEVGTGKTASMIAAAMELRRLGLAKKPAICCLKANIEQITAEAQSLYPGAKILSTATMFSKDKRQQTLNAIATGDYDIVIMTHDHLDAMKMRPETSAKFIQDEIDELSQSIIAAESEKVSAGEKKQSSRIVKRLENQKQKLEAQLKAALAEQDKDDIYFENSGIDMLMVDEAHKFKSLPCYSRQGDIKGIPSGRSQRATNMLMRTRWLLNKNKGRGVVFATGTPIANTMGELFNMQRYLQYDTLQERGLHRFDAWKDTFGDTVTRMEFKLNGDVSPTTRFAEFINLPELRHMASEFMDVQLVDNQKLPSGEPAIPRPAKHDHVVISPVSEPIKQMMDSIHKRAEDMKGKGRRAEKGADNMLNVCNDAKLGSIDMRLLDLHAEDHPDSKVNQCIRNVLKIYNEHPGQSQCIFSDLGVHDRKKSKKDKDKPAEDDNESDFTIDVADSGFSIFKDIRKKLTESGIPNEQIVDFSDPGMTDVKRQEAQQAAKRGDVRIMLGSTMRLGTGTNVQDRLKAIHHLDIPYVPAFIEQRDGRGYRSGNKNTDLDVYKYVQQGSADNLFWQIVANKSNFINQYMRGRGARTMKDLETDTLSPEEMVAVATGDEAMLERVSLEDEVKRLRRSQSRHKSDQIRIGDTLANAGKTLTALETKKRDFERDAQHLQERQDFTLSVGSDHFNERQPAAEALSQAIAKAKEAHSENGRYGEPVIRVAEYRGMPVSVRKDGMLQLVGPSGQTYKSGDSLQSLEYAARQIGKLPANVDQQIKDFHVDVSKMQQQQALPFRHEQTLKEKEARLAKLKESTGPKKLSLVPGVTKVINGVTYTLNQHHRWANQNQSATQPQQPPQQAQTAAPPKPIQQTSQPSPPAPPQPMSHLQPHWSQPPTPEAMRLAAQVGDSPQHRAARQHVAAHYLMNQATFYDHRSGRLQPLTPERHKGMLDGIDLSKPVIAGPPPTIPPPDTLVQWQAHGGFRGGYFSVEGSKPQDLGIHDRATAWQLPNQPILPRQQTRFETKTAKFDRMTYLFSTAAPTIDTWSDPKQQHYVSGGGPQWFIPTAAHPNVRIAKKHEPIAAGSSQNGRIAPTLAGSGNASHPQESQAH
jgi:SPP1 gp7 family putative phage head morphogenesis protein